MSQLQANVTLQNSAFAGRVGSLEDRLGDSPLPTTATNLTGAIQELHTSISTKATTAKANANAAGVAANADNIDDLRAALEAAEATDATTTPLPFKP